MSSEYAIRGGRAARLAAFALTACCSSGPAGAADAVAIFVDGMSGSATFSADSTVLEILTGPQPVRSSSYLLGESPIASLIHGIDPVQKQVFWNGDLFDARSARDAVNRLESLICEQRGNSVDIIAHSLGTVIAYTALAELAGLPGTNR